MPLNLVIANHFATSEPLTVIANKTCLNYICNKKHHVVHKNVNRKQYERSRCGSRNM